MNDFIMSLKDWFLKWMMNSDLTNYIIAFQLPIVLSLVIVSYQYYKIGIKESKLISIGWGINFFYLVFLVFSSHFELDINEKSIVRTILDLATMFMFLKSALNTASSSFLLKIKKINNFKVITILFLLGFVKNINIFFPALKVWNLNVFIVPFFDCFVIVLLAFYFRKLSSGLLRKNLLFGIILFYALIQLTSVIILLINYFNHKNGVTPHFNIDNIGFSVGLICKTLVLIVLSIILPSINKKRVIEEKEYLLSRFAEGSENILDIKNEITISLENRENLIIKNTLTAILEYKNDYLGYFSRFNEKKKSLTIQFTSATYTSLKKGLVYYKGMTIYAAENKVYRLENDLTRSTDYVRFSKKQDHLENDHDVKAALAVPLIIDGNVLGVFMFENELKFGFSDLDVRFIRSLITQAQFAIENNRLLQENELHNAFFRSLSQIDEEIVKSLEKNRNEVLSLILNKALLIGKCKIGSILILDGDDLVCIQATKPTAVNLRHNIEKCLSGKAIKEKTSKYFENVNSKANRPLFQNELGNSIKSEFVVPLIVGNKIIGVFNTESEKIDGFSKVNREKMEGFAKQTSVVIYVTNLLEDIKEKNRRLENSIDKGTIETTIMLSNNISHRIGNSIGTVRVRAEKLLKERYGLLNDKVKAELEVIKSCAIKALKTDEEITKAAASVLFTKPEVVYFKDIKELINKQVEFKVSGKYIIEFLDFDLLEPISVDFNLFLDGVFFELIRNAIKAMPEGGKIIIIGKVESDYNIISISDNGCGIKETDLSKIYDKDYTNWESGEFGTGQGLYAIKNILKYYKGDILEESVLNVGTTFTIYIPFIK